MKIEKKYCDFCHMELRDKGGYPIYRTVTTRGGASDDTKLLPAECYIQHRQIDICNDCWQEMVRYIRKKHPFPKRTDTIYIDEGL